MTTFQEWVRDVFLTFEYGGSSAAHWNADFLRLVAKSDPEHRAILRDAIPEAVVAWEKWQASRDPWVFFRAHNVGDILHGDARRYWDHRVDGVKDSPPSDTCGKCGRTEDVVEVITMPCCMGSVCFDFCIYDQGAGPVACLLCGAPIEITTDQDSGLVTVHHESPEGHRTGGNGYKCSWGEG